jgi:hypothetical protein
MKINNFRKRQHFRVKRPAAKRISAGTRVQENA